MNQGQPMMAFDIFACFYPIFLILIQIDLQTIAWTSWFFLCPILALFSLFQRVQTLSNLFVPIPTYFSLMKPYIIMFYQTQAYSGYSRQFHVIPRLFQSSSTYISSFKPIPAYSSPFKALLIYFSLVNMMIRDHNNSIIKQKYLKMEKMQSASI